MQEPKEKPGLVKTQMFEATTFIELDEPHMAAIRREVKALVTREVQFALSLVMCLSITLAAAFVGLSYYLSGSYSIGLSLALPALAGLCGMTILTYAHNRA